MSAFPQIAMYGHYIQKWSIQFSLLLLIFVFSECCLKLIFVELHVTIMILYWNSFLLKCQITNKILKLHLSKKAELLNPGHYSQSRNIYTNICTKTFSNFHGIHVIYVFNPAIYIIALLQALKVIATKLKASVSCSFLDKKRYEKFSTDYVWITWKQFSMNSRFICCRYNLYLTTNGYVILCMALRLPYCSVDVVGLQNPQADTCGCSLGTPC